MYEVNGSAPLPPRPGVRALVADDDAGARALFATLLRHADGISEVVEASDGAEAVDLALRLGVRVAVLDLNMPRLDGLRAARLLLGVRPSMSVALNSSDPQRLRVLAGGLGLPLFDKLDFDDLVAWVEVAAARQGDVAGSTSPRLELSCRSCGYGIVSDSPPAHCPMCRAVSPWAEQRRPAAHQHAVG